MMYNPDKFAKVETLLDIGDLSIAINNPEPDKMRDLLKPVVNSYFTFLTSDTEDFLESKAKYVDFELGKIPLIGQTYVRNAMFTQLVTGYIDGEIDESKLLECSNLFWFTPRVIDTPLLLLPLHLVANSKDDQDYPTFRNIVDLTLYSEVIDQLQVAIAAKNLPPQIMFEVVILYRQLREAYYRALKNLPTYQNHTYTPIGGDNVFAFSKKDAGYYLSEPEYRYEMDYLACLANLSPQDAINRRNFDFNNIELQHEVKRSRRSTAIYNHLLEYFRQNPGEFNVQTLLGTRKPLPYKHYQS